jgi:hypothetical protein
MKPNTMIKRPLTLNLKPSTLISRRDAMKPKFLKNSLVVWVVIIASFSLLTVLPTRVMGQQVFQLPVPYHSQIPQWQWPAWGEPGNPRYPNGWCTVACLDMIFDYYDAMGHPNPPLPQQEIACVANTNNPGGTWEMDARRAAHFSQKSKSLNQPSWPAYWNGIGYSWRGPAGGNRLGYAAVGSDVAGNWKNISNIQGLKNFLLNGCPLIVYLDIDSLNAYADSAETTYENPPDSLAGSCPVTREGHAEVLLGYDDRNPAKPIFIVHDPGIFANGIGGRAIKWPQNLFYNKIWTGRYLYCAPWVINRNPLPLGWGAPAPDNWNVIVGKNLRVDVQGTYPGPVPLKGFYAVNNPVSTLTPGQFVIQAGANPQNLRNVSKTGSASPAPGQWWNGAVRWTLTAPNNGGQYPISIEIKGTTANLNSNSYANYSDDIGKINTYNLSVMKLVVDPGHPPFGGGLRDPWNSAGILWAPQPNPGSICTLKAVIYNYGEVSVPAGAIVNFYYSDPHTCPHYPDYSLVSIGSATIPPIPPGDSAVVGPVLFTPPPTGNSFGESFFDVFATIYCSQDTIQTGWVLEDNNVAVKSFWTAQNPPGVPFTMHFLAKNYLDGPGQMVLGIDREELPSGWTAQLDLPEDSLIPLPPEAEIPVALTVTPSTGYHVEGTVWVYESLYDSAGNFVRTTGGIGLEVKSMFYSENFNDCDISDWTVYTSSGTFGTTNTQYVSPPCGLRMYSQSSGYAWGRTPNLTVDTTQDFTISTYFKVPNANNHWFWVLSNQWVELVIDYNTDLRAYQGSQGPTLNVATLTANQWYHVKAKVHPATSNYDVYVDGVYKTTAKFPGNYLRYLRLGEFESGGSNYGEGYWDDLLVYPERSYILGDVTGDSLIDASDVVYLLNYLFVGGPAPQPWQAGDVTWDGVVDIADVVYLLNYLFVGGPAPSSKRENPFTSLGLNKLNHDLGKAKIGLSMPTLPEGNLRRIEQGYEILVLGKFDRDIAGIQLEISYDPNELTLLKPELTSLSSGLSIFYGGKDGLQKIGIVDLSGRNIIPAGEGTLVILKAKGNDLGSIRIEKAILVDRGAKHLQVEILPNMPTKTENSTAKIPDHFALAQNNPNPFNPETNIDYALSKNTDVKLTIYNILGEKVKVLVDEHQTAGYKKALWDGRDLNGEKVASGVYFYWLETKEFSEVKKMLLLK